MLTRADITDDEYVFLVSQKILVSQVFDARGRGPTQFYDDAKAAEMLFGLANPCAKGSHRLFTRHGHCIQCDTSRIRHASNHFKNGYVYIAATTKGQLLKVGCTSDPKDRALTLNTEGGYAGFDDWTIIAYAKTKNMGRVEFEIIKPLEELTVTRDYVRAGKAQTTREALRGSLQKVWPAYQAAVASVPKSDRWQHAKISEFDFFPIL
jgi:hypothetical protein